MPNGKKEPDNAVENDGLSGGTTPESADRSARPRVIDSETLLAGRSEMHIRHRGDIYRLTLTRAGKLILHK
jgi:hemin uptake protein HemP